MRQIQADILRRSHASTAFKRKAPERQEGPEWQISDSMDP
jgi:hypothetical protein